MVPHVAQRGHSFKGAGQYYLHDKGAWTNERVGWTHTVNVPTADPEKALKWMAFTAMHAEALKAGAGVRPGGRKAVKGDVYHYSLSWEPDADPDKEHVLETALSSLAALGMSGHEALLVGHDDTDHAHVHIIVNLVHPETGIRAKLSNDRLKLSEWAEDYEREHGKIVCPERLENNERRKNGAYVKHRDPKAGQAPTINDLYQSADSGRAFASAVKSELGLTLAQGNKGRVVLVDEAGKVVNLARQLEGQRAKDIKAKLADLDLKKLPGAKELSDERKKRSQEKEAEPVGLKGPFRAANDNRELEAAIAMPMQRRAVASASFASAAALDVAWEVEQAAQLEAERERAEMKMRLARQAWREIAEPMQAREALALAPVEPDTPSPRIAMEDERERSEKERTEQRKQRIVDKEAKALYGLRNDMQLRHLDKTREMEAAHDRQTADKASALEPVYGSSIKRLEKSIAAARERLESGGAVYKRLWAWRDWRAVEVRTLELEDARQREAEAWAPLRTQQRAEKESLEKSQGQELQDMDDYIREKLDEVRQGLDGPAREQDNTRDSAAERSQHPGRGGDSGGGMGRSRSLGAQARPLSLRVSSQRRKPAPKRRADYTPYRHTQAPAPAMRKRTVCLNRLGGPVREHRPVRRHHGAGWTDNAVDMMRRKGGAPRPMPAPGRQAGPKIRGPKPGF